ncbi:hypothetical protein H7170_01540 [Candidatus Gracilibacteria bacterium]|nr:hypothetical protein [Candidatus Gracilibacteria bacterium]
MKSSHILIALLSIVLLSACTKNTNSINTPISTEQKTLIVSGTLLPKDTISEPVSSGQISTQSFSGNLK